MDKDRLVEIIRTGTCTEAHLEELADLVQTYPWFGLPRFLRLKVHAQLGRPPESTELSSTVVFSSDRKHLYKWVTGALDSMIGTAELVSTELEFLDNEGEEDFRDGTGEATGAERGEEKGRERGDEDPFFLLDDDDEGDEGEDDDADADAKPIPEKDESEMEESELEEPEAIPVMDPLDDEEDQAEDEDTLQPGQVKHDAAKAGETGSSAGEAGDDQAEVSGRAAGEHDGDIAEVPGTVPGEAFGETAERTRTAGWAGQPPANNEGAEAGAESAGNSQQRARNNPSADLIERFLEREPGVIRADQQTNLEGDVSEGSVQEDDRLITDTLAKIYVKQGLHAKAIYAYERLSLKYPEKSAYFAAQIEKIKNNANV